MYRAEMIESIKTLHYVEVVSSGTVASFEDTKYIHQVDVEDAQSSPTVGSGELITNRPKMFTSITLGDSTITTTPTLELTRQ